MPDTARTILVVEDDAIVRMLIVDVLEELEYRVLEAEDATSALTFVADDSNHIDLLMTDQGLPDMKGTALAKKVIELRPQLPVLFASGYSENIDVPPGMHSIGKPFSIDQLRDKVKSILETALTDIDAALNSTEKPVSTRLLIIGYVWPEPRSSAASGHMMQLIQCFLEQDWQITFASPATEGEHRADLRGLGIREVHIALNDSSFDVFVSELQPDVVLFDQFMIEEQFGWRVEQQCPDALRILETSDFQSLRHARHQLLKDSLNSDCAEAGPCSADVSAPQLFRQIASSDLAQREIASLYRCDLNLMTSDVEIALLSGAFGLPAALLHWCPLMIDATPDSFRPFAERAHFLSIGNFRHAPNWDAVLWMKTAIWPLIRQQLPDAQLHIYGAYTPPKASALHNASQGFHVKHWAEDALEVMSMRGCASRHCASAPASRAS